MGKRLSPSKGEQRLCLGSVYSPVAGESRRRRQGVITTVRRASIQILVGLLALWTLTSFGQAPAESDPVLRAMSDELERSVAELQLKDLEKPFFIQYVVLELDEYSSSATFGALTSSNRVKQRVVQAQVRVGDYSFDNSEFIPAGGNSAFTGVLVGSSLEDNYDAIRHALWLATDSAYKQAVELLARKRAYVQNRTQEEQIPDFSKEQGARAIAPRRTMEFDRTRLEGQLREWSRIFKDFPGVHTSSVSLRAKLAHRYIVNSEGARTLQPEMIVALETRAGAQAADGMSLSYLQPINRRAFEELPSHEEVAAMIRQMAADMAALRSAPVLDANYSGPVLLVGQASAEMFARVLGQSLSGTRGPLFERGGQSNSGSPLQDRMNRPVLPPYFSVYDDPGQRRFGDQPLIGYYEIDDQGIPARRVSLIEDGLLTNLLMSRRPGKDRLQSNGHGRSGYPGRETAQIGNLFVIAKEGKSYEDLKKELIELCKTERLPYGIIIKALSPAGGGQLGSPVLTYKVYVADGREELVRGVSAGGLSVQSLRHIKAAGNDAFVANRLVGQRGTETPVSVVAPSVLLEELELNRPSGAQQKPALLTHPYFQE